MQKRLFGLETEYGLYPSTLLASQLLLAIDKVPVDRYGHTTDLWLANGSRLYIDTGDHPEYATPECENVCDLVASVRAGDEILKTLANTCDKENRPKKGQNHAKILLVKNNFAFDLVQTNGPKAPLETAWGSHQNYLIEQGLPWQAAMQSLLPFVATSQIFSGAGHILPGTDQFVLSRRVFYISGMGLWTSGGAGKNIFLSRNKGTDVDQMWRRLQINSSESNMLEFPLWLKFITTHLVLRLIESGWRCGRNKRFYEPSKAQFEEISRDIWLRKSILMESGKRAKAIEIQRYYFEAVKRRLSDLNPEEQRGLADWEWTLDLLSQDLTQEENLLELCGVLDWCTKYCLFSKKARKQNLKMGDPLLQYWNVSYHILTGEIHESLWRFLEEKDKTEPFMKRVVGADDVQKLISLPPDSRSAVRSDFIKFLRQINHPKSTKFFVTEFSWGRAVINALNHTKNFIIDFGFKDPFTRRSLSLEQFKERIAHGS